MPSKLPPINKRGRKAAIVVRTPIVEGVATRFAPEITVSEDATYPDFGICPAANFDL